MSRNLKNTWEDREPTLKEFATRFNDIVDETCVMSSQEGYISSHKIPGTVWIHVDDPDDDSEYRIVELEMSTLFGCSCPSGVNIILKRVR